MTVIGRIQPAPSSEEVSLEVNSEETTETITEKKSKASKSEKADDVK